MRVEIAVQDAAGAAIAHDAGAVRAELCVGLPLGGLTPSAGLIRRIRAQVPALPLHVLIRPRPGGFTYSPTELDVMAADIEAVAAEGVAGVVVGVLAAGDTVDAEALGALRQVAPALEYTFHRAIDHTPSPVHALDAISAAGFNRVLTSGGAPSAAQGLETLAAMVAAQSGLTILAGGGVALDDLPALSRVGITEVHLSAKATHRPPGGGISLGVADTEGNSYQVTDPLQVAAVIEQAIQLP
ncbi:MULTISPECIES: copper homeostasis protein CutC [unclassified Arthrobacter]|uniref:copper homeostasis protein CutC n=1 Tax=unclassified Arthrobacter TaxID=235627 RepID=UPI001492F3EE|nr:MULTISPECIES: copper homeostasis protein CutC [unclassified Arthrobacter]MBE0010631.1 copper homeostasis protein CutC [Arthrobacter sp. AET 35A]NOJ64492.1 copper homeostasis protein CutC [Arthrobacter sp. 147(2020)]